MMRRWSGRASIRFRLSAVATAVVAVVLVGSAIGLVRLQTDQLETSLDTSISQRADTIVASLTSAVDAGVIVNSNDEDQAAQLVSEAGVVTATANLDGMPPLRIEPDPEQRQSFGNLGDLPLPEVDYRVLSRRVETASGQATLHVFESTDDVDDTIHRLSWILAGTVPATILVLAVLMWWLIGRTLRPVEEIRAEVADISGTDLDRRIPVPDRDDEIARLASTMNAMLDRIGAVTERERRFVADASHELRTPLTRIRAAVEIDVLYPDEADTATTNRLVLEETADLQRLVEDLLYLARSDAGAVPYRPAALDLDDVVLDEVDRERERSAVEFDLRGVSAAHVLGDGDQLGRVVRNLLTNASRHARGQVSISLRENGRNVELVVADDGPGVPGEVGAQVFERFTRADDDRSAEKGGTGLGLAIAREIVDRHGGTIALASGSPDGARFVVTLPVLAD